MIASKAGWAVGEEDGQGIKDDEAMDRWRTDDELCAVSEGEWVEDRLWVVEVAVLPQRDGNGRFVVASCLLGLPLHQTKIEKSSRRGPWP